MNASFHRPAATAPPSRPRFRPRSKGQALIEFCLVLPLLLVLLAIVVDLARYVYVRQVLQGIALDGARYATLQDPSTGAYPSMAQVTARVTTSVPSWMDGFALSANLNATLNGDGAVSLRVTSRQRAFLPLGSALPGSFTVVAEVWCPRR